MHEVPRPKSANPTTEKIIDFINIKIVKLRIVNKNNIIINFYTPSLSLNESPLNLPITINMLKLIVARPICKPSTCI